MTTTRGILAPVRSYNVWILGLLLLLAACWAVVLYAVWVIVEWAT